MTATSPEIRMVRAPKRAEQDAQVRILREALAGTVINPALPYAPQVLEGLRSAIISLRLMPGTPLSEAAVASVLGMSRTPVREALRDLSVIGLIDIFPQAGTVVSLIRMSLIQQEIFVREALEGANLFDVMRNLDADGRLRIQSSIDLQASNLKATDITGFFSNDEAMHRLMFELTGRLPVWTLVSQAKQHIDRARLLVTRDNLALCKRAYEEHLVIKRALFNGEESLLREALHRHVRGVAEAVLEFNGRAESAWFVD